MTEIIEQSRIPKRILPDGRKVPAIGLGTFGSDKYSSEQIAEAVYGGIKAGYRMIDCASVYQNEDRIGESIERVLKEGIVERSELFITSKVWNDMHGEGKVAESCEKSIRDLRSSYLDLYLVHWPFPNYHAPGCDGDSRNPDSRPFSTEEFMSTWRQCEALVDAGKVKYIGMSNMTITKLEQVLPLCRIKPTVLEVEINPTFQQPKLFAYCKAHDILPIAFSPMGSPCRPERDTEEGDVVTFEMPELVEIAKAHNCHPALICMKWAVQRGHVPIPFSIYENEYVGNLRTVTEDFLTDEEMEILRNADKNARLIKGKVFLWEGAKDWRDIWDREDEKI